MIVKLIDFFRDRLAATIRVCLAVLVLLSVAWNQAEYSQDGCDERFCNHIFIFYGTNIKKNVERCK